MAVADLRGLNGDDLVRTSRLTAKVDNNCISDGFQIYLHAFVVAANGEWAVVQQGMNDTAGMARRYHWHSASVTDFLQTAPPPPGRLSPCRRRRSTATSASVEEPKRSTLEALRRSILEVVPDAEQCISYGMPAFKVPGQDDRGFRRLQGPPQLPAPQRVGPRRVWTAAARTDRRRARCTSLSTSPSQTTWCEGWSETEGTAGPVLGASGPVVPWKSRSPRHSATATVDASRCARARADRQAALWGRGTITVPAHEGIRGRLTGGDQASVDQRVDPADVRRPRRAQEHHPRPRSRPAYGQPSERDLLLGTGHDLPRRDAALGATCAAPAGPSHMAVRVGPGAPSRPGPCGPRTPSRSTSRTRLTSALVAL